MKCLAAIEGSKEAESGLLVPDLPAYETNSHCGVHLRCLILITCLLDLIPGPHGRLFVLSIALTLSVVEHLSDPLCLLEMICNATLHAASKVSKKTSDGAEVCLKMKKEC